ncbi:MAG: ABC transporter six-transmembrane domain-containing protein [Endozoicomonas sp.]
MFADKIDLLEIIKSFKFKVGATWLLVLLENTLLALIPLQIGFAIDGLLTGQFHQLGYLAGLMMVMTILIVIRRIYDTRAYGTIRVHLAISLNSRYQGMPVSIRNARLEMGRELVDFMENQVPEIITAIIQLIMAVIILGVFHAYLALSALAVFAGMMILYSFFHQRFYDLNSAFNGQMEQQVDALTTGNSGFVSRHFRNLRKWEVKLSDTEACVYGLIFLLQIGFIIFNLWYSSVLTDMTTGKIFSIINYSWEFVGAAFTLPIALQSLSRLHEVSTRINRTEDDNGELEVDAKSP